MTVHFLTLSHYLSMSRIELLTTLVMVLWLEGRAIDKKQIPQSEEHIVSSAPPIVEENLGLVLLPSQILAHSTQNLYQSVFYKMDTPAIPTKVCNMSCTPDMSRILEMEDLQELSGCWVPKMRVMEASVLAVTLQSTIADCFIQCLVTQRCGMMTYDETSRKCWIQTTIYYKLDSLDDSSTSQSARMDCILENHQETRESLCQNKNELFEGILGSMRSAFEKNIMQLIQKFTDVTKAYDLNVNTMKSEKSRETRSWQAFDFLSDVPILGHFYEILKSPSENRKMKQHLQDLEGRFQRFAEVVYHNTENTRVFQNTVLEIIEANFVKFNAAIHGLKCDIASLGLLMAHQQVLNQHLTRANQLLFAPRHGVIKASIPQTLSLSDLELVVQRNVIYTDTLYQEHPEVLYRVGDLYLMNLTRTNQFIIFHYLLVAPKLQAERLHRTYAPVKVPIAPKSTNPTVCFEANLPAMIMEKNNRFFAVDTVDCIHKNDIILCQQDYEDLWSPSIKESSCLSANSTDEKDCELVEVPCETKILFTKAGALVFSREDILGMKRSEKTKLEIVSSPGKWSYFFLWRVYSMIQTDRKVIYAPDNKLTVRTLEWRAGEQLLRFDSYLEKKATDVFHSNISHLKELVENTTLIITEEYEADYAMGMSKNKFIEFCSILSASLTVVSFIGLLVMFCVKTIKKNNKLLRVAIHSARARKNQERLETMWRYVEPEDLESLPRVPKGSVNTQALTPLKSAQVDQPKVATQGTRVAPQAAESGIEKDSKPTSQRSYVMH